MNFTQRTVKFNLVEAFASFTVILFLSMFKLSLCRSVIPKNSFRKSIIRKQVLSNFSSVTENGWKPFLLTTEQMKILIGKVDALNVDNTALRHAFKFTVHNQTVGLITQPFATLLNNHPDVFEVNFTTKQIKLNPLIEQFSLTERSDVIQQVNWQFKEKNIIKGWRDELYPVSAAYHSAPLLLLERAAVPFYGTKAYGVHLNGYIRDRNTQQISHMWVARRSKQKSTWPGMLDHIVAGGQPHGMSLQANVIKECHEEASIPESLASQAKPVGIVSYIGYDEAHHSIKRDTLFCYDLELPPSFQPIPNDQEVEWFQLHDVEWVLQRLLSTSPCKEEQFKPNCNLVIIDFFIRHGLIDPESPRYVELSNKLSRFDSF